MRDVPDDLDQLRPATYAPPRERERARHTALGRNTDALLRSGVRAVPNRPNGPDFGIGPSLVEIAPKDCPTFGRSRAKLLSDVLCFGTNLIWPNEAKSNRHRNKFGRSRNNFAKSGHARSDSPQIWSTPSKTTSMLPSLAWLRPWKCDEGRLRPWKSARCFGR